MLRLQVKDVTISLALLRVLIQQVPHGSARLASDHSTHGLVSDTRLVTRHLRATANNSFWVLSLPLDWLMGLTACNTLVVMGLFYKNKKLLYKWMNYATVFRSYYIVLVGHVQAQICHCLLQARSRHLLVRSLQWCLTVCCLVESRL